MAGEAETTPSCAAFPGMAAGTRRNLGMPWVPFEASLEELTDRALTGSEAFPEHPLRPCCLFPFSHHLLLMDPTDLARE